MDDLLRRADEDPWSLDLEERKKLAEVLASAQAEWLPVLQGLVEPPEPGNQFPAFLLATGNFEVLRELLTEHRESPDSTRLDTGTADTLQRFVDHYRVYLEEVSDRSKVQV
ncbi:MAG: hypothetical protein ACYTG5_11530 [Planctomycetota bacterium]|jgi:hypothetical protein